MSADPLPTNAFLDYALTYAARGWRVFPLVPGGKAPITQNGFKDASTDSGIITEWWARTPNANVGLALENAFVLDIDPGKSGHEHLDDLEHAHGRLPDTLQQITGSGGRHYIFKLPGFSIKNSSSSIAPGIDIKAPGGYVVVPPSTHISGRIYAWDGTSDCDGPILDAPAWLLNLIKSASNKSVTTGTEAPDRIGDGKRNATLTSFAGAWRRSGAGQPEIIAALTAMNNTRCDPPLPTREVERICQSICRYAPHEATERAVKRLASELAVIQFPTPAGSVAPRRAVATNWHEHMIRDAKDQYKKLLGNSIIALQIHPEWHGSFKYNQFGMTTETAKQVLDAPAGTVVSDVLVSMITSHMQEKLNIENATPTVFEAIETVAREWGYHPVRDYLNGLAWDGTPRIETWLSDYLGVAPSNYAAAIGRCWLISAVARVMQPGCKADACLILEGKQGIGKSTALRVLGGEWFSDDVADFSDGVRAAMQLRGKWIIEISELDAMNRSEVTKVKSFLSRQIDNYRLPYGRKTQDVPRQGVFAGSTNQSTYLTDDENRRFWPVACGDIDTDGLYTVRDQLWAEAYVMFTDGRPWHLSSELALEAAEHQAERRVDDPWAAPIAEYCQARTDVTSREVLVNALGMQVGDLNKSHELRFAHVIKSLGFRRKRGYRNGVQVRVWST